ncbi:MAG: succinate--CoA ligase subunit beta [Spirochaetales bacterium]|uniref:Succinate--CoA ligase subunit beta n=1 Tax=Candidatus Thalassospirochaeta sargassi TaxID=3119039 RepID=A0AAJ1MKY3_9SPIO|nr:succinate--CoA ligase subunit beta [Spirochaetales bacterium]
MKLFEYQAKEIFRKYGIKTPAGMLFEKPDFDTTFEGIGYPAVIKSQVLRGGRGKAGLIRFAGNWKEAAAAADDLYKSEHNVSKLLVEKTVDIRKEIYLSVTIDPEAAAALVIACADGGVEVEAIAKAAPEKILRERIDIERGILPFQAKIIAFSLGLEGDEIKGVSSTIMKLYSAFRGYDAELAEINPLFITRDGDVIAGDGKFVIDDAMLSAHPEYSIGREYFESDAEYEAALDGIPYLQFDGGISLMCAGAGLTTAVYDLISDEGGSVANYLEFGGPNYRRAKRAMELCLKNDSKVILIVTFGTIARADVMAEGIVEAIKELKPRVPIVTCIRGTNEEEAVAILKAAGLEPIFDTEEAVRKAVAISNGVSGGHV